jgi:hypothetical protein
MTTSSKIFLSNKFSYKLVFVATVAYHKQDFYTNHRVLKLSITYSLHFSS